MFHFGFSYVGLIYLFMLFIPNFFWTKYQPKDYEKYVQNENKFLQILERIGEVLVCCFVLIFSDFNIRFDSFWFICLPLSFCLMLLYEVYWIRYFKSEKTMSDFYRSLCMIPVAGATLPVFAFFLLGIYGGNIFLIIATLILGIGHIGIHWNHYKEISESRKKKNILLRIVQWIIIFICIYNFVPILIVIGRRNISHIEMLMTTYKGVNEEVYVTLGGQEQYLLIQGADVNNPVIIWLHGGPATPDAYMNYVFQRYLVSEYTIINWDQRGCGRTFYHNISDTSLKYSVTPQQAQIDIDELVDYACNRFDKDKVIIVGHSYGTLLGSQYVLNHPDKVVAYVGIGQTVSSESEIYSYEDALTKAIANGDDTSEMERAYRIYKQNRTSVNRMILREYIEKYHKLENAIVIEANSLPYFEYDDMRWKTEFQFDSYHYGVNQKLFEHQQMIDVRDFGLEYQVPVGFISGAEDWVTPTQHSKDYCALIDAPKKQFVTLEGCGHSPQYDSPKEFCDELDSMLDAFFE